MAEPTVDVAEGRAGLVETRGIEPVPAAERTGSPMQLFWVWFAANISILGLPLGAALVVFQQLTVWQAVVVAAIGAFGSFALVGVVSIAGRRGGAPSLTLSRATFGVRGNLGPSVVALLSRLGWETVNTTTGAFAILALFSILFQTPAQAKEVPLLTLAAIGLFAAATVTVSGLGHHAIVVIQKWATWVFGALNVVVAVFLVARVDVAAVFAAEPAPLSAVVVGIGVIAAGTGIGWANSGADMARYQGERSTAGRLVAVASVGAGIPLVLLVGLGALLSAGDSSLAQAADPVAAIRELLPTWMAVPYLLAALGGLLLSNHLSVYSAGLTWLTLGLRIRRTVAVLLDVVATLVGATLFMLVADGFYGPFIAFISLLAIPITAWVAVFLVDLLKRTTYQADQLMVTDRRSAYWYTGGVAWRATGSWLAGMVAGFCFVTADPWFHGPLADTWLGTNGLGWVVAFAVAGLGYLLSGGAREPGAAVGRGSVASGGSDGPGVRGGRGKIAAGGPGEPRGQGTAATGGGGGSEAPGTQAARSPSAPTGAAQARTGEGTP